jgi:hypothetical protein
MHGESLFFDGCWIALCLVNLGNLEDVLIGTQRSAIVNSRTAMLSAVIYLFSASNPIASLPRDCALKANAFQQPAFDPSPVTPWNPSPLAILRSERDGRGPSQAFLLERLTNCHRALLSRRASGRASCSLFASASQPCRCPRGGWRGANPSLYPHWLSGREVVQNENSWSNLARLYSAGAVCREMQQILCIRETVWNASHSMTLGDFSSGTYCWYFCLAATVGQLEHVTVRLHVIITLLQ